MVSVSASGTPSTKLASTEMANTELASIAPASTVLASTGSANSDPAGEASSPAAPSPLAGEGEGEGSRNSSGFASRANERRLRAFAKSMRREPTNSERALWSIVRGKRLEGFKFKRQQPLGPYIADMACLGKRLIVEADGGHHNESARDTVRDAWLAAQGFRMMRFWNHDILGDRQMVEDTILRELFVGENGGA